MKWYLLGIIEELGKEQDNNFYRYLYLTRYLGLELGKFFARILILAYFM